MSDYVILAKILPPKETQLIWFIHLPSARSILERKYIIEGQKFFNIITGSHANRLLRSILCATYNTIKAIVSAFANAQVLLHDRSLYSPSIDRSPFIGPPILMKFVPVTRDDSSQTWST